MASSTVLLIAGLLLALMVSGGLFLRYKHRRLPMFGSQTPTEDTRLLYLFVWLASLSILAYIVFAFGK